MFGITDLVSVHTERELLHKLQLAGLDESLAQVVIGSEGNEKARQIVEYLRSGSFIVSQLPVSALLSCLPVFHCDLRNENWNLLEDTKTLQEFNTGYLELFPFLRAGETSVCGETMLKRARGEELIHGQKIIGCQLGQRQGEALLLNQNLIETGWQTLVIVLTGTIWQDAGHEFDRYVPCLIYGNGMWTLSFDSLSGNFNSHYRLLRLV